MVDNPLISIVAGTYNRRDSLVRMYESAKSQIPRHIPWELVVVDGGSSDDTIAWCEAQDNVHLIQHGELLGAIKAFCDGARAARGEYVIMGNDDIVFLPGSIMRAVSHLEDTPECGAVAFADNRSQQAGYAAAPRVEQAPALLADGQPTSLNYAQVGLFRRWLGEFVGWWGDLDPVMGRARTYGGDNWLSAKIWELGYRVDAVDGVGINDMIMRDGLRQQNAFGGNHDSQCYYAAFPQGPRYPGAPTIANPQEVQLRIMVLPIYEQRYPGYLNREYGLSEALAKRGITYEIDYVNSGQDIPEAVAAFRPHLMLTQCHGISTRLNASIISRCRAICPEMVVVNWNHDAHLDGLKSPEILEYLRYVDLQLVCNAGVLPDYEAAGIRAEWWQIGFKEAVEIPEMPHHTIVFLGNMYNDKRRALVDMLKDIGPDVGFYGNIPGAVGNTHYDFGQSAALYRNCTIAISDTFPGTEAFVSNRLLQALGNGAFVLQEHSPNLDKYMGLRAGEHYIEWNSLEELRQLVIEWCKVKHKKERARIAKAGQQFIRDNYTYDCQVDKLLEML